LRPRELSPPRCQHRLWVLDTGSTDRQAHRAMSAFLLIKFIHRADISSRSTRALAQQFLGLKKSFVEKEEDGNFSKKEKKSFTIFLLFFSLLLDEYLKMMRMSRKFSQHRKWASTLTLKTWRQRKFSRTGSNLGCCRGNEFYFFVSRQMKLTRWRRNMEVEED
jgi:hypothetical protein